jgi:hypothetical protein
MRALGLVLSFIFSISAIGQEGILPDSGSIEMEYLAEKPSYLELSLWVQANFTPVYLRNTFIIAADTFYDYVKLEKLGMVVMKTLKLDSGEHVVTRTELFQEIKEPGYELIMEWRKNDLVLPEHVVNKTYVEFLGTVWPAEQKVLFRFKKNGTHAERLVLHIGFTPGFDYSSLFVNSKMVYEYESALEKELEINVNPYRRKNFDDFVVSIPIEGSISRAGEYYIELEHIHFNRRLNGISYISIERVKN